MKNNLIHQAKPSIPDKDSLWFVFHGDAIFLTKLANDFYLPNLHQLSNIDSTTHFYMGQYNNQHCYALELINENAVEHRDHLYPLRRAIDQLGEEQFLLACKIKQLLRWHRHTQFCGLCGQPTILSEKERAKICTRCQRSIYPELSPAIIVLIKRGKEILLARSPHFLPGIYSILAGFVEPGESVEEAIHREVFEEVNLRIKNIQYAGSQSWPFPNSLMLGFIAEYESGELTIDGKEIVEAGWFSKENLPQLPNSASIARKIIEEQLKIL